MIAILYEHPEWFDLLFGELERRWIPFKRLHAVINGIRAYAVEISKVRQPDLFRRSGVAYPRPTGAAIVRFDSLEHLSIDGTALVQEFLPARGGSIVRVEALNGEFLYAFRISPDFTSFNICPADVCPTDYDICTAEEPKKRLRIEHADPPPHAIEASLRLAQAADLDIGGLEYLVNDRNDEICFYDYLEKRHGAS